MIPKYFQDLINTPLKEFFIQKKQTVHSWDLRLEELIAQIESVTLRGGDRLRPYMCALGYQIYGLRTLEHIIPLLLALELFHSFALIHDDIIDAAVERRGGPTISAYFTQNLRNSQKAGSLSLLAGDLSLLWAYKLLYQLDPVFPTAEIQIFFQNMAEVVIFGQALDVWGMEESDEQTLLHMYEAKSGNYSIQKPLLLGALLAGAKESDILLLTKFGHNVGLAFQLKDDLLGVFGEANQTGKSTRADIYEGKWTLLMAITWKSLAPNERGNLKNILGNKEATAEEIDTLKEMIVATQSKVKVESQANSLVEEAKQLISQSTISNKQELSNLADFVIQRNY